MVYGRPHTLRVVTMMALAIAFVTSPLFGLMFFGGCILSLPVFRRSTKKVKRSASELLGLQGLLRHFVETQVAPAAELEAPRASFAAACRCLDLLLSAKRGALPSHEAAARLESASAEFLELHKMAYGTRHIKPKHHWAMDLPAQLRRDRCVLDAFIIERIHLQVKGIAEHVKNTQVYERSVMAGICNLQERRLATAFGESGLEGRQAEWPAALGVLVANRMNHNGLKVGLCVRVCLCVCD